MKPKRKISHVSTGMRPSLSFLSYPARIMNSTTPNTMNKI